MIIVIKKKGTQMLPKRTTITISHNNTKGDNQQVLKCLTNTTPPNTTIKINLKHTNQSEI